MVKVSIIIKALNEEAKIARAIESALEAVSPFGGEVVLADSLSTDRTVEIASKYPIRIVQLKNAEDRCCGIGAQLGYLYANGEYVYLLDGDMKMHPQFLPAAIALMDKDINVAGVGGRVIERNLDSLEYKARQNRAPVHLQPGIVDRLDGGGLYRRAALEKVGFFTNSNLHSYEELDLAIRLRTQGFQLQRIDVDVVDHYGHNIPAAQLLKKRWNSLYICGSGEVLRSALGQPHLPLLLKELKELWLYTAVLVWWLLLFIWLLMPVEWLTKLSIFTGLLIGPWLIMVVKKRSLQQASYSIVSWGFHAAGLLKGVLRKPKDPYSAVKAAVIVDNVEQR